MFFAFNTASFRPKETYFDAKPDFEEVAESTVVNTRGPLCPHHCVRFTCACLHCQAWGWGGGGVKRRKFRLKNIGVNINWKIYETERV